MMVVITNHVRIWSTLHSGAAEIPSQTLPFYILDYAPGHALRKALEADPDLLVNLNHKDAELAGYGDLVRHAVAA